MRTDLIWAAAGLFPRKRLSGNYDHRREYKAVIGIILPSDLGISTGKKRRIAPAPPASRVPLQRLPRPTTGPPRPLESATGFIIRAKDRIRHHPRNDKNDFVFQQSHPKAIAGVSDK